MDLQTSFLNLRFKNPILIASSPLSESVENILKCYDAGVSGIIAKSCSSFDSMAKGFRRCYIDNNGFWATSTFEREIQDISTSFKVLSESIKRIDIPVFASVTEPTLNFDKWQKSCKIISESGISGIQLDLFYLENLISEPDFDVKFTDLLNQLTDNLNIPIFPKLNINLPSKYIAYLLKKTKIKSTSLLDSISIPPPFDIYNRGKHKLLNIKMPHNISLFGNWQFPLTKKYTFEFINEGFETCSGGGIVEWTEVIELIMLGASVVQIASDFLINGLEKFNNYLKNIEKYLQNYDYNSVKEIKKLAFKYFGNLGESEFIDNKVKYNHMLCSQCKKCVEQIFCNNLKFIDNKIIINEKTCEGCSFCVSLCINKALYFE